MRSGGYQTYRQTEVITADPRKLVIMCYEEAIRSLNLAATMYSCGEYEVKGKSVQKALDIISELREALDFERGGTIATSLETLYTFMTSHIIRSDQARNVKGLQQVASMLGATEICLGKDLLRSSGGTGAGPGDRDLRGESLGDTLDGPVCGISEVRMKTPHSFPRPFV